MMIKTGKRVFCCECVEREIGNIHAAPLRDIWLSKDYAVLRQKAFYNECLDWQKGAINCSLKPRGLVKRAFVQGLGKITKTKRRSHHSK
jgi:hypothetical protein